MNYQTVTLYIIAVLNSNFSYFILIGKKNISNILFSLVTLSVALWALSLAFFINTTSLEKAFNFANLYYTFAAIIPLLFFYFTLVFPNGSKRFKKRYYLFSLPFIILSIKILTNKNFILKNIFFNRSHKEVALNQSNYLLYGLYFLFFVIASYYVLIKRYKLVTKNKEKKKEKAQFQFIIWGTGISYLFGMLFNLFLPWFKNYNFIWLGPVFTLIMVISIGYSIVKHHLFDKKIIITEILVFSLLFFTLVRTIISKTFQELIINIIFLIIMIIFSALLIRSVLKETKTREKIERLAGDLKIANTRLKKLDKQKSEFISLASHQLRAPVASLKGYSSMIIEGSYGPISKKVSSAVQRLFQSSQSLSLIIDDFLNLSRIERGKIDFIFSLNNIKKITNSIVEEIKPKAIEKGVKIYFEAPEKTYISNIDGEKIKQTISNLIDNAIKYSPKGIVNIKLSKKEGFILLEISDNGIGILKDDFNKLFKKFSRLSNANKTNIKGTGLGLYLAKQIIKAHQGEIWAESKGEGRGSTFCIKLKEV